MTITLTQLYDELKEKLGKDTAEHLVQHLESRDVKQLATKEDVFKVKDDMHKDIRQLMWMIILLILPLYGLIIFQILKP